MKKEKKYFVLMETEKWGFTFHTNSKRIAMWLVNRKFWSYAKVHEDNLCICCRRKGEPI